MLTGIDREALVALASAVIRGEHEERIVELAKAIRPDRVRAHLDMLRTVRGIVGEQANEIEESDDTTPRTIGERTPILRLVASR